MEPAATRMSARAAGGGLLAQAAIPGGGRRVGPAAEIAVIASGQLCAKGKASEKGASINRQKPAPRTDSYFSGDLLRGVLSHAFSSLTQDRRGAGRRRGRTRLEKAEPGRELGRRGARRTCSPPVKPLQNHKTPSPQALVSFMRSPPRRLQ